MAVSKTQIDRLGDRLKVGSHTESDLRLLDDYRRSFGEAYELVVRTIRQRGEFPTGRLAKSTVSIVEKLRREKIRLSQMQDIAGCRVVVMNVLERDQFVSTLKADFPEANVIDRRDNPSHGYRAVHIIAEVSGKPIEIQVRSSLQHLWAELSEKSSDVLDPTIKYGGGTDEWRNHLTGLSVLVANHDEIEKRYSKAVATKEAADAAHKKFKNAFVELPERLLEPVYQLLRRFLGWTLPDHQLQELRGKLEESIRAMECVEKEYQEMRDQIVRLWNETADLLTGTISWLEKLKEQKQ